MQKTYTTNNDWDAVWSYRVYPIWEPAASGPFNTNRAVRWKWSLFYPGNQYTLAALEECPGTYRWRWLATLVAWKALMRKPGP